MNTAGGIGPTGIKLVMFEGFKACYSMVLCKAELMVAGLGSNEVMLVTWGGRAGKHQVQTGEFGSSPDPDSKSGPGES